MRFSAISLLFSELPFLERFRAAARIPDLDYEHHLHHLAACRGARSPRSTRAPLNLQFEHIFQEDSLVRKTVRNNTMREQ
jgi:hypothetical protein